MDKETMQFLSEQFGKINGRLDGIDDRLDKVENRLDVIEVRQDKMSKQLTELQIAHKRFELSTNTKLSKLQDGMDTIEEILRVNDLLPN